MNHERGLLDDMRNWTKSYFQNEHVITREMYKLLKDLKGSEGMGAGSQEFDLLVKIIKVFEKDENTLELRIKDIS